MAPPDPEPTPLTIPPGETARKVFWAVCRGIVGGALWSLPFSALCIVLCWNERSTGGPLGALQIGVWVTVIWAVIAGFASALRATEQSMPEGRQVILRETRRAALRAALFATPVAVFYFSGTAGYGVVQAVLGTGMLLGIWVGSAALVGYAKGLAQARKEADLEAQLRANLAHSDWIEKRLDRWPGTPEGNAEDPKSGPDERVQGPGEVRPGN
jgi:hypothetical protein